MLKLFSVTATLSTILVPLLPNVVLSFPVAVDSPYPEVSGSNMDSLICYVQTEDGRTIDLNNLCRKTSENNSSSGISFGTGGCYLFDATGRPCTASAGESQKNTINSLQRNETSLP